MVGRSAAATPNQEASVAAYWSTDVVGIQRPLLPVSSGPPGVSVGQVPNILLPCTAPPTMIWCPPQAWSVPPLEPGWNVRENSESVKVVTLLATPSSWVAE